MVPTCTLHLFLFTLFNELAVLMNLGHISHHFRPLCQGCDRPYYALPFDDILRDVSCTCIVDYLVLILYNFDNKHTFIVIIVIVIVYHGIPWNLECANFADTRSSMEFHGTPWNLECANLADRSSSMEFHGTWNTPISMLKQFHGNPWN